METVKIVLAFIGAGCVVIAIGISLLYLCFTRGVKEEIKNLEKEANYFSDVRNFN